MENTMLSTPSEPEDVALCIRGDIGMAAGWPSGCDFGAHAWHGVGVRPFLCGHHGCELEIPLYSTHRFHNRDYLMFDCGGMAFSEAGFHASVAIVTVRGFKLHHYRKFARLVPRNGLRGDLLEADFRTN